MMARYRETVLAPWWFRGATALAVLGALGALVVPTLTHADFEGDAPVYYAAMAIGTATLFIVIVNFTAIQIVVGLDRLVFGFGWFRRSVPLSAIREVKVVRYDWWSYGGWGLRIATGGRWAYSLPGLPEGVEVTVEHRPGKLRRYFISSRRAQELAQAVRATGYGLQATG